MFSKRESKKWAGKRGGDKDEDKKKEEREVRECGNKERTVKTWGLLLSINMIGLKDAQISGKTLFLYMLFLYALIGYLI